MAATAAGDRRLTRGATVVQADWRHARQRTRRQLCPRPPAAARAAGRELLFELPELQFPARLNCAAELLDRPCGRRPAATALCIRAPACDWTYAELQAQANRIARVLVRGPGPGAGQPRAAARRQHARCWRPAGSAVVKAGGIAVATHAAAARQGADATIIDKAADHATRCATRALADELEPARAACPSADARAATSTTTADGLEARDGAPSRRSFANVDTAADDICLIAFTSGTTGEPKGTMHFHRDVMAACACWPPHVLRATPRRRLHRQPAAGLHLRPRRPAAVPAARRRQRPCCSRRPPPEALLDGDRAASAPRCCSPRRPRTARWRRMAPRPRPAARLRKCVSAGEALPAATRAAVARRHRHRDHRRHRLHRDAAHLHLRRRGARHGPAPPASRCPATAPCVLDDDGQPLPPGTVGRLAVQGPHRLPLPRRRAPDDLRAGRLEPHRRRLPAWTTTATSATRRAPTT
ncbi:MAG: AMP-binding protein [Comamonadaceae bacterium]|nr:AMP-binding protein [Comamonadaceae bacterium]